MVFSYKSHAYVGPISLIMGFSKAGLMKIWPSSSTECGDYRVLPFFFPFAVILIVGSPDSIFLFCKVVHYAKKYCIINFTKQNYPRAVDGDRNDHILATPIIFGVAFRK